MSVKWQGILTGCPAVYYWEERTISYAGGLLLVCFSKKLRLPCNVVSFSELKIL